MGCMDFVILKVRIDNHMYLFYDEDTAIAFDPYDYEIIDAALSSNFNKKIYEMKDLKKDRSKKRRLKCVFVTHSHYDHNRDVEKIKDIPVYSGDNLKNGQIIENILCLHTPCHTKDSFCFKIQNYLITGDTFFYLGVGKFFEGTPEMMIECMNILEKMDENIILLYGHDYSEINYRFASKFFKIPDEIREKKFLTIKEEKMYNPFIRWKDLKNEGKILDLKNLREMKDAFSFYE